MGGFVDWAEPWLLLLVVPAALLLWWSTAGSVHPMPPARRRAVLVVRVLLVVLVLFALADPAWQLDSDDAAVIFVIDHSDSLGSEGIARAHQHAEAIARALPASVAVGAVSAADEPRVLHAPERGAAADRFAPPDAPPKATAQTDLAAAVTLAFGLFPPGTARHVVIVSDGLETRGDLVDAARDAALKNVTIDAIAVGGPERADARVVRLRPSRSRSHEGAAISLTAELESSVTATTTARLFENGVEVESREVRLTAGEPHTVAFRRTPEERNLYRYLVRIEGIDGDAIPENDEGMTLVEVRGRPLLLYVEGEPDESRYLVSAMAKEGIRLHTRPPEAIPDSLQALAAYDGIIFSDVAAHQLRDRTMAAVHDYVELLGGGFLMIGGVNSFGVGGYYRTPIEEILPVRMQPPDTEERFSTALCLVLDRSGSMSGPKIEICKAAAVATSEMLTRKDFIGVVAFDSAAHWVVPMTQGGQDSRVAEQVAMLTSGGGTNMYPGMEQGYYALRDVKARVKHMIVLTDGQTRGDNYQELASRMKTEGITVSAVGVGHQAALDLLRSIAHAGGGEFYHTFDPASIPRIFTRDTAVHLGKLIREETFVPQQVERHPMLEGWNATDAPPLLGYVKTIRRATTQVPLVTDIGDPLLAHWRFGLGKVTAFTSDCKSRWAALWVAGWEGYSQFWGQVLREMARNPQGRNMDIRLDEDPRGVRMSVDLLEDAARFQNAALVEAEVYFLPAGALGGAMQIVDESELDQVGPGRYEARFHPDEPGVYLVRARAGADMVTAGYVHEVSSEAAVGRVDGELLARACEITGGRLLEGVESELSTHGGGDARFVYLAPWILRVILVLFLIDLALRRWENVLGVVDLRFRHGV